MSLNVALMRLFVLLVGLCVLLPTTDADAARRKKPKPPQDGMLVIFTTNPGASVEIDGKPAGQLPFKAPVKMKVGDHTIRVHLRGYSEHNDTFTITAGEETELEIDLIPSGGIVKIATAKAGATVTVNGKPQGITPFDQVLQLGAANIVISRPGFKDEKLKLDILPGKTYEFDLKLVPLMDKPVVSKPFYETWWFWTVVGLAVAGGTTAAIIVGTKEQSVHPIVPDVTVFVP